jgi:hypothetical protein
MTTKPKNLLRKLRSGKKGEKDKKVIHLLDAPAAIFQSDACENREYCVLETNARGTWYPDAWIADHDATVRYLKRYDGEVEWLKSLEESDELPDQE